jgi:hypothetical protein
MDRDEPFLRHINARYAEAPIIGFVRSDEDKTMMRIGTGLAAAALILGTAAAPNSAMAQTKADQCATYAKEAAAGAGTSTGPARGAARGAAGAAIIGGDSGKGAAAGAVVGGVRKRTQANRSYQSYYDECMKR